MKLFLILLTLSFSISSFAQKRPEWVNNPSKKCKKTDICSVGSGINREAANADAQLQLARIFDNKIAGSFSQKISSDNSHVSETSSEEITQNTEVILKGVTVIETFDDGESVYLLASLNKSKSASMIKNDIEVLDQKIKDLTDNSKGLRQAEVQRLFEQRQILDQRHEFLAGRSIPHTHNLSEMTSKRKREVASLITHVYLDEDEPKAIEQQLATLLSKNGLRITRGQVLNPSANFIVTGELSSEKQYLKVEGFEKYSFRLKISAKNASKRISTGEIMLSTEETGRNFSQAHSKAISVFKDQLEEKLGELNIEEIN